MEGKRKVKARENVMAAGSAQGRKERSPFLASIRAYLARLPSSLQLRPQGFSVRKWEEYLPLLPFFKVYPLQTPATHSTLKSLGTRHFL